MYVTRSIALKKLRGIKHEKEFDTMTITTDIGELQGAKPTQVYEPRPLTPDDDLYEDIIEQFASAPTKPKYWFEEFGD